MRAAAVGDRVFISTWGLIGVEGFEARSEEEFSSILTKLINKGEYSLIFVPESLLDLTENVRRGLAREESVEPIFVFVPEKRSQKRLNDLRKRISLAIGVSLGS